MTIVMQCTKGRLEDILVHDDGSVFVDGVLKPDASISELDGVLRVSVEGDTFYDINPYPTFSKVRVTRVPGYLGALGWKLRLLDVVDNYDPGVTSLALYTTPGRNGQYHYTLGAMQYFEEEELWGFNCSPGHEPGEDKDCNFSFLYASLPYSFFTLFAGDTEREFYVGGDAPINGLNTGLPESIKLSELPASLPTN
jgi:hypothetical protein